MDKTIAVKNHVANLSTFQCDKGCSFKNYQDKASKNVQYIGTRYGGEYGDDPLFEFKIDGETVEVGYNSIEKFWYVIWGGAVDYEGNLSGLKKRYPELRRTGRF